MVGSPHVPATPAEGAKVLQERLNHLLTKLSSSIEVVKSWPSTDGEDASIHVKTTSKLIASILEIKKALENVEGTLNSDVQLRKALQGCPVPINLLDLLDHGNGLNPDCFSRGLLREAMGQLAGLKRRKLALEMLGSSVQLGLNKRMAESSGGTATADSSSSDNASNKNNKRSREAEVDDCSNNAAQNESSPALKKVKTET